MPQTITVEIYEAGNMPIVFNKNNYVFTLITFITIRSYN